MNTPSHHRVHHGRNPKYIDKNHGGTFILFDKWFGTFQEEEEKPTYGITTPVRSWNPLWINIAHYATMKEEMKQIKGFKDKIKYLFHKPGWLPSYLGGYRAPKEIDTNFQKFDTVVPSVMNWYILFQYILVLVLTGFFLFKVDQFDWLTKTGVSLLIIWTTVSFSGVFEKRSWYFPQEIIRVLVFALTVYFFLQSIISLPLLLSSLGLYTFASLFWLWKNQKLTSKISTASL